MACKRCGGTGRTLSLSGHPSQGACRAERIPPSSTASWERAQAESSDIVGRQSTLPHLPVSDGRAEVGRRGRQRRAWTASRATRRRLWSFQEGRGHRHSGKRFPCARVNTLRPPPSSERPRREGDREDATAALASVTRRLPRHRSVADRLEDLPGEPGGVFVPGHRGSLPSSARRPGGLGAWVLQAVAAAACGGLTVAPVVRRSVGGCQPGFSRALVASAL